MVGGVSSRPSSRKQRNVGCIKPVVSHKYSTISAAVLNQLLPSPKKFAKSKEAVASQNSNSLRNISGKPNLNFRVPTTLPKINHTCHDDSREPPGQGEKTTIHKDTILPELGVALSINSPTHVDEFLHNKLKSTKGCSEAPDDEAEKRRRQKTVLKQQIEEKRRLQEHRDHQRQHMIMEEEERVKRELALLQQRWDKEIEQERKQGTIRFESTNSTTHPQQSVHAKTKDVIVKHDRPKSASSFDPLLVEKQESRHIAITSTQSTIDAGAFTSNERQEFGEPELLSNHKRLEDNLLRLTELCKTLLKEQQQMKAELEDQKRQTMLALQEKKSNEMLQQQLNGLQQQLTLLTPSERAMLRIRAHRRKNEFSSSCKPQKNNLNRISNADESRQSKSFTRKRGSWATQSKAIAPAPRESISEIISEGEHPTKEDTPNMDQELGVTKFVYPGELFWGVPQHEFKVESQNPASVLETR